MSADLAERVQQAFKRCNDCPEAAWKDGYVLVKPDAFMAMLELRNMCPEIVMALEKRA